MRLTEHMWDMCAGALFACLALFFLVSFNHTGIESPTASYASDNAGITPRFFPDMVCAALLFFSCGLLVSSWLRVRADGSVRAFVPDTASRDIRSCVFQTAAMGTLILLSVTADILGIVLAGFVFYVLFAFFTGERRVLRPLMGGVLATAALYYLFVEVAGVPVPLGPFSDLL